MNEYFITFKVSFIVDGQYQCFEYNFDRIPSKHDLKVFINNAVEEYIEDLGISRAYSELDYRIL